MMIRNGEQTSRRPRATVAAALISAILLGILAAEISPAATPTANECLGRSSSNKTVLSGTYSSQYRVSSPRDYHTYDARKATFTGYPYRSAYPFLLGKDNSPAKYLCVVGGKVKGQQPRDLTWNELKEKYDGDGLRIEGNVKYVVDGLRVYNVEDGVSPRGTDDKYPPDGDGFVLRNLYFKYIRDDCVENDMMAAGRISDSLFDGCYTGISERPSRGSRYFDYPAPSTEKIVLNHVLMRMQPMPGPYKTYDKNVMGYNQIFKWSEVANKPVIKNSIFLVEAKPQSDSYFPFPRGTVTENVTIIWRGGGSFKWRVPSGTRVTTDRSIWDRAKKRWLARHGCTSFDVCTKLHNPDPISSSTASAPATTSRSERLGRTSVAARSAPVTIPSKRMLLRFTLAAAVVPSLLDATVGYVRLRGGGIAYRAAALWGRRGVEWSDARDQAHRSALIRALARAKSVDIAFAGSANLNGTYTLAVSRARAPG